MAYSELVDFVQESAEAGVLVDWGDAAEEVAEVDCVDLADAFVAALDSLLFQLLHDL